MKNEEINTLLYNITKTPREETHGAFFCLARVLSHGERIKVRGWCLKNDPRGLFVRHLYCHPGPRAGIHCEGQCILAISIDPGLNPQGDELGGRHLI